MAISLRAGASSSAMRITGCRARMVTIPPVHTVNSTRRNYKPFVGLHQALLPVPTPEPGRRDRHGEVEVGPPPHLALDPYLSAVRLDDGLTHGEPQSGPRAGLAVVRRRTDEHLKNP